MNQHIQTSEQANILWLRWLVFVGLFFLTLYSYRDDGSWDQAIFPFCVTLVYALTNIALTVIGRTHARALTKWAMGIFLMDVLLVGMTLYGAVGFDADLYLICFMIIYLSTLGRRVRDTIPLAIIAGLMYMILFLRQNPDVSLIDPQVLLRFPFFFILALFTTYLSEETEKNRVKILELERARAILTLERDSAVSELQKKQAELVQAEKLSAMGHLAGAMAHEIRNPLCVIVGYVGDLIADIQADNPLRKRLEIVARCADRCNQLVNNLLSFSRMPTEEEPFSLNDAIVEALALARIGTKALNVKFVTDFKCDESLVGHRTEIQQVILNLSTNAIDAMPQSGTLTVRTEQAWIGGQEWAVIAVEDTGTGIPENIRERIFEPFFTTKESGKGTGLGLGIVRDIVVNYKGNIEIFSETNQGTRIVIRLPLLRQLEALPLSA